MVFEAVELLVMAIAIAELNRHIAVDFFFEEGNDLLLLQLRVAGAIDGPGFGKRGVLQ